jgi:hypothetical protein
VEFSDDSKKAVPEGQMVFKRRIEPPKPVYDNNVPELTTVICRIKLKDNWRLKSKFRFTLTNPDKETQRAYIQNDKNAQKIQLKLFSQSFSSLPFNRMPLQLIADTIRNKIDKFWDLEFPPDFRSVYDISIDSPLDVYVHWRRPEEFLHANYDLGLLQPVVF